MRPILITIALGVGSNAAVAGTFHVSFAAARFRRISVGVAVERLDALFVFGTGRSGSDNVTC